MVFSNEDKALIKNLYLLKGYGSRKLISEFPEKKWKKGVLDSLLKKLRETGSTDRQKGSGRPKSVRTDENVAAVESLVLRQEDQPQTHRSIRQISRETAIARTSVLRIIHHDLTLTCFKKRRAQELSQANRTARMKR